MFRVSRASVKSFFAMPKISAQIFESFPYGTQHGRVAHGDLMIRTDWREKMLRLWRGLVVGTLVLAGTLSGQTQSLDRYGWAFEIPFPFLGNAVTGPDGALYIGGAADDVRFRSVNYPSTTGKDIVVLKILPSGALAWIERFGGAGTDGIGFLSIDESGRLIVSGNEDRVGGRRWVVDSAGQIVATLDGAGSSTRLPLASGGGFVEWSFSSGIGSSGFSVLDSQGEFVWSRKIGPNLRVQTVRGLADNTFLAIGHSSGELGQIGKNGRLPDRDEEWVEVRGPFIARFGPEGELLWAKSAEDRVSVSTGVGNIDENGNAIFGGTFSNALRLGRHRLETGGGEGSFLSNAFIVNWDSNGNVKWIKHLASDSGSNVKSIAVSAAGTAFVAGEFNDAVDFEGQSFVEDPIDEFKWAGAYVAGIRPDGSAFEFSALSVKNPAIVVAPSGELYLRGWFDGERQFGPWVVGAEGKHHVAIMARLGDLGPTIAEHPMSLKVADTERPSFEVLVTGSEPFELQWRKDGVPLEETDRFRGVNESRLNALQSGRENAGSYDVVATTGSTSVTSRPATVSFENSAPVFTTGTRVKLDFNQVDEEIIHRLPLAVEDSDGDQSFTWVLNDNPRFRAAPVEVSLLSTTGVSNELIVRWPAPEGRRFDLLNYQGAVVVTDPAGAAVELPVQVVLDPLNPTRLVFSRGISLEEDSAEIITNQRAHDDDIHPRYINSETLKWSVSVQPETLGKVKVTTTEGLGIDRDLAIAFTPTADAHGAGEVILQVIGSLTPEPISYSIPLEIFAVNDAPRLLSAVTLLGDVAVGSVVRGDIGEWVDPETDVLGLKFEVQWFVNDRAALEGAQELPGANSEELLLSTALLERYIALRVSVTDERVQGHRGQVETTIAYSEFHQVGREVTTIPDFSQLPVIAISGGYRMRVRPDAFGSDWILEGKRMINLRDPELGFDINDRVVPPFRSQDSNRDWLGFYTFGNQPNWIGMRGSSIQDWVFDVRTLLDASQRITPSEALFTYFTGRDSNKFSSNYIGVFVTPGGDFFRLSESKVTNSDVLYLDASDGTRVTSLENGRVSEFVGGRAVLRANRNVSHVLFIARNGAIAVRRFPSLELVSETMLAATLKTDFRSAEWGLSEDGARALVETEGLVGQKRMVLLNTESGALVRDFRLDAAGDFIVSLPSGERDQSMARAPLTVTINQEAAFVIERNTESEEVALLDFVSWNSGEIIRTDWIEKGTFHRGDDYHPDRPGQFLYASALSPALLVHDFASGEVVERLSVPERLLSDGDEVFKEVRTSHDGRLIFLSNQNRHTVAFHPLATGEVRGVVFEDRNGNGQLDFGLIQSETPHIVYVIDVSGSVAASFVGSAVGDVNFDGKANTILDAELAAFGSFHRNLIRFGQADDARVAVVGFSEEARAIGLEGVVEPRDAMMSGTGDSDGDLIPDVLQALRQVRLSTNGLGGGTDFLTGLALARDIFGAAGTAPEQANIIFLSDGEASNNFQELTDELKALGVNIRGIGVGQDSSLQTLRRMDPGAIQVASSDELIAAFEPEERLLEDVAVYADFDASGSRSDGELSTSTLSDNAFTSLIEAGGYSFRRIRSGSYPIRADIPEFEVTSNPVAQVQPVVPTIHLIAMQTIHQVDPPSISIQPVGGEWEFGQTVRLSAFAVGSGLRFQWLKNGSVIAGETSNSLTLENVQVENAGEYSVSIANDGGTLESAVATVVVRVSPRVIPLGEAMDAPQLTWRTGGAAEWRGTAVESFVNGSSATVSGIGDGREAWFETEVTGPGTIEFYWKVSSEAGEDFLRFERSGEGLESAFQISGETDWSEFLKFNLTTGVNVLRWTYRKNANSAAGQDAAWVDALVIELDAFSPVNFLTQPQSVSVDTGGNASFVVNVTGSEPFSYQWYHNDGALPGEVGRELLLTGVGSSVAGQYRVEVSNVVGSVSSEVASLNVVATVDPVAIVVHPRGVKLNAGESAAFFVVASGGEPLSYQWRKNGVAIPSATRDQLLLQGIGLDDMGDYDVVVSNLGGQVISQAASVVVISASVPPPVVPPLPPTAIPAPILSWDRDAGGLVLGGRAGVSYVIEATSDPVSDSWVPVTTLKLETDEGAWVDPVSSLIPVEVS